MKKPDQCRAFSSTQVLCLGGERLAIGHVRLRPGRIHNEVVAFGAQIGSNTGCNRLTAGAPVNQGDVQSSDGCTVEITDRLETGQQVAGGTLHSRSESGTETCAERETGE